MPTGGQQQNQANVGMQNPFGGQQQKKQANPFGAAQVSIRLIFDTFIAAINSHASLSSADLAAANATGSECIPSAAAEPGTVVEAGG